MNHPTILVVEDNPVSRKVTRVALETEQFRVLEAEDGATALDLARNQPVDLVLLDVQLSDSSGFAVVAQLRTLPAMAKVPILALTGYLSAREQEEGWQRGVTDILLKPITSSRLMDIVNSYLPRTLDSLELGKYRRLLLVDDSPTQLKLLKIQMEAVGFGVKTATNGREALECARRTLPDAIISDVLMPEMDGFRLCQMVRQDPRLAHLPVILVSSEYTDKVHQKIARSVGATRLLLKCGEIDCFRREIIQALEQAPQQTAQPTSPLTPAEYSEVIGHQLDKQVKQNTWHQQKIAMLEAKLAVLGGFSRGIEKNAPLVRVLQEVLQGSLKAAGISSGAIYLADNTNRLELTTHFGFPDGSQEALAGFFKRFNWLRRVSASDTACSISPSTSWGEDETVILTGAQATSLLAAPLLLGPEHLGVVVLTSREGRLGRDWLDFAQAIANQIAASIALARTFEALRISEAAARKLNAELEIRVQERTAELEKARSAAEAANRAKSEFLSRMSHELRTPLNGILGFAQRLSTSTLPPRDLVRVSHIFKAGQHLLDLINEVLDISRIEAGRLPIAPEPLSVRTALVEAINLVLPLAQQQHLQIKIHDIPEGWHVLADGPRLKQVLLNLLSNAIKYNRAQGRVTITALSVNPERIQVAVTDTGMGIPADKLAHLFEPFNRLGAELTNIEGTGLGLALSKRLVELMDGTLTVASDPHQGTTFTLELPRARPSLCRSGVTPAAPLLTPLRRERTLLYIEDNLDNISLVEDILADRPEIRLLPAPQGGLGLELARQHHPDLILLDIHLPDMRGDEFLKRLQAEPQFLDTPVVVLSADTTADQIERLHALGVREYLTKPLDLDSFLAALDRLFADEV